MPTIIINIPDSKLEEFKLGFKRAYPSIEGETDLKLIKRFIKEKLMNYYITGKTLIATENLNPEIDENVISD